MTRHATVRLSSDDFRLLRGIREDASSWQQSHAERELLDRILAADPGGRGGPGRAAAGPLLAGENAQFWDLVQDEIGFGISTVPDEDGELRRRCLELLDEVSTRLRG